MSNDFHLFAKAVNNNLNTLSKQELYTVDGIDLFTSYLLAFPEGTNPIYRKQTEHECSCCKQFIRGMGNLVAIVDGKKQSVWACEGLPAPYDTVSKAMDALVTQLPISGVFRSKEPKYGAEKTVELLDDKSTKTWNHFHGIVARKHISASPAEDRGMIATTAQVFKRGLEELTRDAMSTVLDLIQTNAIYRGQEHLRAVQGFDKLQREYLASKDKELFVWTHANDPATRFRNTVIGTLVQDLSEGVDLDRAVRGFETKVAPTNYKRTTALITPKMVDAAINKLEELGLSDSDLQRRMARAGDLSVNDVLWLNGTIKSKLKPSLRDTLKSAAASNGPASPYAKPVSYDELLVQLRMATKLEVLLKNSQLANFVTVTAPSEESDGRLFKWSNNFAWSYDGEVTDSIKERVKAAGGNTNAALRVSLAWHNSDDLDIHCYCPDGHIYFGNRYVIQDVDMNAFGVSNSVNPVENLSWKSPKNGVYMITVDQYQRRSTERKGFTLQLECNGATTEFQHPGAAVKGEQCISFKMLNGQITDLKIISKGMTGGSLPTEKWGIKTEEFIPVQMLMNSPNHWDGAGEIGNKHVFFIMEGCLNPNPTRGIYTEFLRGDLEPHRKVFEVLASKTKCEPTPDQLSGLGFSSTRKDKVLVRMTSGTIVQTYDVSF